MAKKNQGNVAQIEKPISRDEAAQVIAAFVELIVKTRRERENFLDYMEEVLRKLPNGWEVLHDLESRAKRRVFGNAKPGNVPNALGFLDDLELKLGSSLECVGSGIEHVDDHWEPLLSALTGAWHACRFVRRELDPKAWGVYEPHFKRVVDDDDDDDASEEAAASDEPSRVHARVDLDSSDNDGAGSEVVS